jgi:hypothetical protein
VFTARGLEEFASSVDFAAAGRARGRWTFGIEEEEEEAEAAAAAAAEEEEVDVVGPEVNGMNLFDSERDKPEARARLDPLRIKIAVVSSGGAFDKRKDPEEGPAAA